jgi:hypothetical protein
MFWATVPETTVHKNGQTCFDENEIRFAENRLMPPPSFEVMLTQKLCQRYFRFLITASANPRHYFRPLRFCENVGHSDYRSLIWKANN